nr:MAG TPA: hypothetical protein [Caudoviricetes sp.]
MKNILLLLVQIGMLRLEDSYIMYILFQRTLQI